MPGIMSSYKSCMIPRTPIRGLRPAIKSSLLGTSGWGGRARSALAVLVLVAAVQRVDLLRRQRFEVALLTGEPHGARDVFAHHRRLHGGARGAADSEHAVAAQQHRGRAVPGQRL